jgi:hypothetical protein
MKRRKRRLVEKSALGLMEEAVALLRSCSPGVLAAYYLGSFPFVLGLLFFWAEMSRSNFAEERVVSGALGVALLFLWMKSWQSVFCGFVRARLRGTWEPWDRARVWRLIISQVGLQPTALFLLPLALVLTIPFGWVFAFYQNVTVLASEAGLEGRQLRQKAIHHAMLWPGQNHLLLACAFLVGCLIFLNIGIALIMAPGLLKSLLGIDTVFTLGIGSFLNTTFLAILAGLTYLCLDPLLKTVFTLRCFYGDSVESGEDLEVQARQLSAGRSRAATAVVFLGILISGMGVPLQSAEVPLNAAQQTVPKPGLNPAKLDQAIERVITLPEYSWRLPRERRIEESDQGFLSHFLQSVVEMLKSWFNKLLETLRRLVEWIARKLFPENVPGIQGSAGSGWTGALRLVLIVLIVVSGAAIALILFTTWRRRNKGRMIDAEPVRARPDLTDESVRADELPRDEWIGLAVEMMERGEFRLALRAFYLGGLAHLASRELIQLTKYKSNREYETELRRRSRGNTELTVTFSQLVGVFDRVWYGRDPVNRDLVESFRGNIERINSC